MIRDRVPHRPGGPLISSSASRTSPEALVKLVKNEQGAALLEFAVALPLLVVFTVGIFDFSGAFNQRQKIEQAAQEGAIIAGAQPMSDIATTNADPVSLHPVAAAVFNSLVGSGVLPTATTCTPPGTASGGANLTWTYTMSGCPDTLAITINRGAIFTATTPAAVGTTVTVVYPYHWRFNSVIQLLVPGANYAATTQITEASTVHNQL